MLHSYPHTATDGVAMPVPTTLNVMLLVAAIMASVALAGCDPVTYLEFDNRLDGPITVHSRSVTVTQGTVTAERATVREDEVPARSVIKVVHMLIWGEVTISIRKTGSEQVLLERHFTKDELRASGKHTIVIQ